MKARQWTERDVIRLLRMREQKAHTEDIAKMLDRTDGAVRLKLCSLGYSSANVRTAGSGLTSTNGSTAPPVAHEQGHDQVPPAVSGEARSGQTNDTSTTAPELTDTITHVECCLPQVEADVRDDLALGEHNLLAAENRLLRSKNARLLQQRSLEERWLELFRSRLEIFNPPTAPLPAVEVNTASSETGRASAVLLLSDCHIGQIVSAEETGGFGHYDIRRYCECLSFLEVSVLAALRERSRGGVTTEELVVFLLGDIIHGALEHGAEREQTLLVADQFQLATWTLHQFLSRLAAAVPRVRIYTAVGNHGRFPSQRKMPTVGRFSNFDYLVYAALAHSLQAGEQASIKFELNPAPRQVVQIQRLRFLAGHGDHLRGGEKQGGLPVAAVARDVNVTTQRHAAARQAPVDFFVVGDKHRHGSLPLATGSYIFNGCFPGTDEFSAYNFAPSEPVQILFWIDAHQGKTWQYDVKLRFAPALEELPYRLPPRIRYLVDRYGSVIPPPDPPPTQC